jgi:uncharacterized protein YdhG (YjbR/CyaY superfamily)
MVKEGAANFEEYARGFPLAVRRLLKTMRQTIRSAAPGAEETISYRIPAFKMKKILVWYGAHTGHIGLYPGAAAIAAFKKELSVYKNAKGSVQFPFGQPLPLDLVSRMVKFRVKQQAAPKDSKRAPSS